MTKPKDWTPPPKPAPAPKPTPRERVAECLRNELAAIEKRGPRYSQAFSYERTMTKAQKVIVAEADAWHLDSWRRTMAAMNRRILLFEELPTHPTPA